MAVRAVQKEIYQTERLEEVESAGYRGIALDSELQNAVSLAALGVGKE